MLREASIGTGSVASIPSPSSRRWPYISKCPWKSPIRRIVAGRESIGYYESGQDLDLSPSREESFRTFQQRLLNEYDRLTEEFGLVAIDATDTISKQQKLVREYVKPLLPGIMEIHGDSLPEALSSAGLTGRYVRRSGSRRIPEMVGGPDG